MPTRSILKQVLDKIDHAVIICDLDCRFIYWNDSAKRILVNYEEVKDKEDWTEDYGMYHMDKTPYKKDEIPLVKAVHGKVSKERMLVTNPQMPKGAYLEVDSVPIFDENDRIIAGAASFKDITQAVKIENFVVELTQRLEHLSNLIKNDFFGNFTPHSFAMK